MEWYSSPMLTFSRKTMEELNVECVSMIYTSYSVVENSCREICWMQDISTVYRKEYPNLFYC